MTRWTTALCLLMLVGCDSSALESDAGETTDAGMETPDAGPPIDPTTAAFEPLAMDGEGPWGRWGTLVARLDDSRSVIIGGTDAGDGATVFADAWLVTTGETGLSATLVDATGPGPRYCGCAAYDPSRDRVIVYGGRDLDVPAFDPETWELDLAAGTWTPVPTATQHATTLGCMMAWAPDAEAMFLFGGASFTGASADLHRYDPSAGAWVAVDASGPVPRYDGALFPSAEGDALYLFGGSYGAMGAAFYADLWRFDPSTGAWQEIVLPDGPVGRRTPWIVQDPAHAGLYVGFGYDGTMSPLGDLFYLDLDARAWTEVTIPFEGPGPRGFALAMPGGSGALAALVGGYGTRRPVADAWRLVRP